MFKKLISNLPFNPSLLGQVSFYAKRLHQEESIRRLGFGFMALAMFIQVFAVMAPPQKSLAYSNDYIINGLQTRDDILRAWDGQTGDANVAQIYGRFGLTRDDIAALPLNPNVTIASNQADYWTIGRTSLSAVSKAGSIREEYKNSEVPVDYGVGTVYLRQLKAWDIVNPVNYYQAFQGTKNGKPFWILVNCGNFTTVGQPPLKAPALDFRKTIDGGPRALKLGDSFSFRFEYRNSVPDSSAAQNVVLHDQLDLDHFDVLSPTNLPLKGKDLTLPLGNVSYTPDYQPALVITVRLKPGIPNGTLVCNAAKLTASNAPEAWGGGAPGTCITVMMPVRIPTPTPAPTPQPLCKTNPTDSSCVATLVCTITVSDVNRTTKESTFTTVATSSNPTITTITGYAYNFGDKTSQTKASASYQDTVKHVYKDGTYTATATVSYKVSPVGGTQTSGSTTCAAPVETQPDQPLTPSKTAQNITQKLSEKDSAITKANPKDVIEYTLNVHNSFGYDRTNYSVNDYIGDLLDYTDLDLAFLDSQGGSFDAKTSVITWPALTVKANSDVVKKFRVTVKDPIPSTNQPGTMSTSFDCVISNKYGTEVTIPINCPTVKSAEYIAATLPNTGPGTSMLIGGLMTIIVAYFFARARLLGKEMELIRAEYAAGGGF
jgi:hypothetical protein